MKLLLVAATPFEIAPSLQWLEQHTIKHESSFVRGEMDVQVCITGVGMPATMYHLAKQIQKDPPDLAIQAGIAGSFRKRIPPGSVFQVVRERYGDLGAETADGNFIDLVEMDLLDPQEDPFRDGWLEQPDPPGDYLPTASAISVNRVHGAAASIQHIRQKYDPDLESMEGAAFFEHCLREKIRFLSLRAVSNFVEPRNRDNWQIPLAIDKLNEALIGMLEAISGPDAS